jgi:hypothetical protein
MDQLQMMISIKLKKLFSIFSYLLFGWGFRVSNMVGIITDFEPLKLRAAMLSADCDTLEYKIMSID